MVWRAYVEEGGYSAESREIKVLSIKIFIFKLMCENSISIFFSSCNLVI